MRKLLMALICLASPTVCWGDPGLGGILVDDSEGLAHTRLQALKARPAEFSMAVPKKSASWLAHRQNVSLVAEDKHTYRCVIHGAVILACKAKAEATDRIARIRSNEAAK